MYQHAARNAVKTAESCDPVNLDPEKHTLLLRDYIILFLSNAIFMIFIDAITLAQRRGTKFYDQSLITHKPE